MCSFIPGPIYPVSDIGGSIFWWLVILVLTHIAFYLLPLYVWSRTFTDRERKQAARSFSLVGAGIALIALSILQLPFVVLEATIVAAFLFVVVRSILIVRSRDSMRERIVPIVVFSFAILLLTPVGWFFGVTMCGTEPFPDYFIASGFSWDDLDRELASLETGQVSEFTALDPLACDACPEGPEGHYVAYRCDELVIERTGARYLENVLFDRAGSERALIQATYDRETGRVWIDGSCPLEYVEFE